MKKAILVAGLLFAPAFAVQAEENVYAVELKADKEVVALGEISLPATITGRVASASSTHPVSFQVVKNAGKQSAAIYTNTGTGAVFQAWLSIGDEDMVDITSSKEMAFNNSTPYVLLISAAKYQEGASYAVRLGNVGDFTVSFDGNGGTVSTTNKVYTPGQPYGAFPTATRVDHAFSGWSTAATNGIVLTTNAQVCVGYTTLYAQWEGDPLSPVSPTNDTPAVTNYYVKFDANGGTGTMSNQTFTVGVKQALATNVFTCAGYDFRGWATSAEGAVEYADCAVVSNLTTAGSTKTLYASWMISSSSISTYTTNGVTWHYSATSNGVATIQNVVNGKYVAAVDTSVRGTLTIPDMIGSNTVEKIGERAFAGCSFVTNVVIPLGVETIGSYAFADCKSLSPGITIPESVETMGAYVFTNCPALKIVRYLGNCPDAADELYAGTPSDLISGVLRVRSGWPTTEVEHQTAPATDVGDDDDDWGGDEGGLPSGEVLSPWPEGDYERRVVLWVTQPVYKVLFWSVPGNYKTVKIQYYIPGRVLGDLPDAPEYPTNSVNDDDDDAEDAGYAFLGWFMKPYGGEEASEDIVVNRSFSLYAHWKRDDDPDSLSEVEYDFASAHAYDGYLLDDGENVVGTIQLKASRGKYRKAEEETNVTATATIVLLGEGKIRLKGTLGEDLSGTLTPTKSSDERELSVTLGGSGMDGSFDDYTVVGVRDILGKKTYLDRTCALAAGDNWKGNYVVVLKADSDESSLGNGYAGLSVQVKANGKGRVTGTMPDGTKVAYTGRLEISDESCSLPVVVPLHRGKMGGFGFLLTFSDASGVSADRVSSWRNTTVPFTSALQVEGAERVAGVSSDLVFALEDAFDIEGIDDSLLPSDVPVKVSGTRWQTPKADRVKFVAKDAAYEALTERGNPSGLTLAAKPGQGTFRGRFKVFAVTEAGKSKKYTATVNGAVLDGAGYGTATIKKAGAVPVTVRAE
ncbi:MAG: InlB B-repeat-containing protein [Kiritimatiellae bacterium]|nr:InlB B-repeat-containing protein [Kiritimatiellia bacterium]